jgi:hypothetical protein
MRMPIAIAITATIASASLGLAVGFPIPALATDIADPNRVNCQGGPCNGTEGEDRMIGSDQVDAISAFGADDTAFGNEGDDDISGGAEDDLLGGGPGRDTINGGTGHDDVERSVGGHHIGQCPWSVAGDHLGMGTKLGDGLSDPVGQLCLTVDDQDLGIAHGHS